MVGTSAYRIATGCLAVPVLILLTQLSFAQDTKPSSPPSSNPGTPSNAADDVGEIVVTATRVSRAGYLAPTPTTVVDAAQIEQMAPATIADFVNELPQFANSTTPRTTGPVSGDGLGGVNFLNLRGLGADRTLVLLDGRRVVSSATIGAVDINLLPSALIQRVDIVTGGASAAWGSDAVAGVVNFVLNDKFEGFKVSAQGGISSHADGAESRFEVTDGTSFASGRGHLVISGSYAQVNPIDSPASRSWYSGQKFIANPAYTPTNGQPKMILASGVGLSNATDGGLISTGPLRGSQFLAGGVPAPFTFGSVSSFLMLGGTPNDVADRTQLQAGLRQASGFANLDFDLNDRVTVFGQFNYGLSLANTISVPYFRLGNITIQADNAYLDPTTEQRLAAAGATNFTMGRTNYDFGPALADNRRSLYRGVAGLKGTFGDGWSWDAYYEYGQTDIRNEIDDDPIVSHYNLATDAVINPASGQAMCRSTLSAPSNGCVPVDLFGAGSPSQAARNYIEGTARQDTTLQQHVAAASVRGDPFATWAGPVSMAAGAEFREEKFEADADPISIATNFWAGNFKPSEGAYHVGEGFVEIVVPLLRDLPAVKSLDLNSAVRETDYNTSGTVTTWKQGLTWDVSQGIRLRGTVSRDIRAPNLNDLYLASSTTQQSVADPLNGNATVLALHVQTGNTNLKPEIARTYTGGFVLTPSFARGLDLSVDYFDIKISEAITTLTSQQIVDGCYGGQPGLCSFITRNSAGTITQIVATGINASEETTSGVDLDVRYRLALADLGASFKGVFSANGLLTYTGDHSITVDGVRTQEAGDISTYASPKIRAQLTEGYEAGPASISLRERYIGSGVFSNAFTPTVIADNHVPAVVYLDLSGTYRVPVGRGTFEVFATIENLLNKAPPASPAVIGNTFALYGVNPALYDTIGTMFRLGARFSL
jgi:iron complex outermembrane receptor protein